MPRALLAHVADPHERPRVEHAGDALLLVLHYPSRPAHDAAVPFVTRPLSIILTPRTMSVPTLSWF